jgi:Tfp pilus assembly protein PilW
VRAEDGVTVVELLVAAMLLLIMCGASLAVMHGVADAERNQQVRADTLSEMRNTLNRVTKEVRQATSVRPESGPASIVMDTRVNGAGMQVVYDVVDGALRRSADGGGPVQLVQGVSSSLVFCYDAPTCSSASPATTPSVVRITLQVQPPARDVQALVLRTEVKLRNTAS